MAIKFMGMTSANAATKKTISQAEIESFYPGERFRHAANVFKIGIVCIIGGIVIEVLIGLLNVPVGIQVAWAALYVLTGFGACVLSFKIRRNADPVAARSMARNRAMKGLATQMREGGPVAVVGGAGSGKTTFLIELCRQLGAEGYGVAVSTYQPVDWTDAQPATLPGVAPFTVDLYLWDRERRTALQGESLFGEKFQALNREICREAIAFARTSRARCLIIEGPELTAESIKTVIEWGKSEAPELCLLFVLQQTDHLGSVTNDLAAIAAFRNAFLVEDGAIPTWIISTHADTHLRHPRVLRDTFATFENGTCVLYVNERMPRHEIDAN